MSCDIGIIGAGVMGSNLALNIAEKNFKVALFARTFEKMKDLVDQNPQFASHLEAFPTLEGFVAGLKRPRKILILVPAGAATDGVIEQLKGILESGDVIVDTGNAHFKDQTRRAEQLEAAGLRFLGMGISGGAEGARKGPAFFPGGTLSVWEEIAPIIEAAAAKAEDGRPCVTMNGKGGAGSCVKMYHNAGEYAILQVWGEVFDLLRGGGLTNDQIGDILESWSKRGFLTSYMLDISIEVARAKDTDGTPLTDKIKDRIGSKGTGLWSVQEALEIGVPAPSLNAAVLSRQLTMIKNERIVNATTQGINILAESSVALRPDSPEIEKLYTATCIAIVACYAQMFQCLRELDKVYGFGLNLPKTIATFRAGCILKGYLLQPMTQAFEKNPDLPNLLCAFPELVNGGIKDYREIIAYFTQNTSVAIPVLQSSLVYINAMFQPVLRYGQMVSLQRDVFGRHGFERVDKDGSFSHEWRELQ